MTTLFRSVQGEAPLLIDIPHAGTALPERAHEDLSEAAEGLPDTDWHVDKLTGFAAEFGASLLMANFSRYVVDLNRSIDDVPLYRGPTTGLIPEVTFDGEPTLAKNARHIDAGKRIEQFWTPYHRQLEQMLAAIRERHGFAVLLDLHSIRSRVPRLFEGRLPDLNLGTYDGRSCAPELQARVAGLLDGQNEFSVVVNERFKGGYITRHYGQPDQGIHALQIEIAQACYMDESSPAHFDPGRAAPLQALLEKLVADLVQWRPA